MQLEATEEVVELATGVNPRELETRSAGQYPLALDVVIFRGYLLRVIRNDRISVVISSLKS